MSTLVSLDHVKLVDSRTKDIVFGWIRKMQSNLPQNETYYTIPSLVCHWCLLYYFLKESFDPDRIANGMKLSEDDSTLQTVEGTAHLQLEIGSSAIHHWKFKLIESNGCSISIGICNTKNDPNNRLKDVTWSANANHENYGNIATSALKHQGGARSKYGRVCKVNDVIEMILDLNKSQLKYIVNGADYGVAFGGFKSHDTSYRAVVSAFTDGSTIKLLSYECR